MMDDDFWTTEISNTRDKRYGGGEFLLLIVVAIGVVAALASYFSHH